MSRRLTTLPLGAVSPRGWLLATLERQAEGLTGNLDQLFARRGFRVNPVGPESVWLGGKAGKDFLTVGSERAPYYLRGLVALSYVLKSDTLINKALPWLESWFIRQSADGQLRAPGVSDYEWWPRMLILDVLRLYYEATGDNRAINFALNYCHFQMKNLDRHPLVKNLRPFGDKVSWAAYRGGDNLELVSWLHGVTEESWLLKLADKINDQTYPWESYFLEIGEPSCHGVNLAHGLRKPAAQHLFWPHPQLFQATAAGLEKTMRYHGQISGSFSGDENTHGRSETAGTELCTIVELMRTYEELLKVFALPQYSDHLERLTYNALPAAIAPDFRSHQYFSQQNQVYCTVGHHGFHNNKLDPPPPVGPWYKDALTFGAPAGFPCCVFNYHQGWPLFVAHMWMLNEEGDPVATAYGPCSVNFQLRGVEVNIEEQTDYPFELSISFKVTVSQPVEFALYLRKPAWCSSPRAYSGDNSYTAGDSGWIVIKRIWNNNDTVTLELPSEPLVRSWQPGLAVEDGPLVYAYNPPEQWQKVAEKDYPTYELLPSDEKPCSNRGRWHFQQQSSWNFAISRKAKPERLYSKGSSGSFPWDPACPPLQLKLTGRPVSSWGRTKGRGFTGLNASPLPEGAVQGEGPEQEYTLIPYGCARLRIALFPELEDESKK